MPNATTTEADKMTGIPLDIVASPDDDPAAQTATVSTTVTINGESKTITATGTSFEVAAAVLADGLRFSVNEQTRNWLIDQN